MAVPSATSGIDKQDEYTMMAIQSNVITEWYRYVKYLLQQSKDSDPAQGLIPLPTTIDDKLTPENSVTGAAVTREPSTVSTRLTHSHLGDLEAISKMQFSVLFID